MDKHADEQAQQHRRRESRRSSYQEYESDCACSEHRSNEATALPIAHMLFYGTEGWSGPYVRTRS